MVFIRKWVTVLRLKKIKILLLLLCIVITLSGCSYSQTGIESLLQPPRLSKEQNKIYSALEVSRGKNLKLRYPRKGDYKSAFLIKDIDDEPTDEAIVFFESSDAVADAQSIRIAVLDQIDGKWIIKYETGVSSAEKTEAKDDTGTIEVTEIEKVSFLKSGDKTFVIMGFNLLSNTDKLVKTYQYSDEKLNDIATVRCSNFEVFDLNNDNTDEMIVISNKNTELEVKSIVADVYRVNATGISSISQTQMDPTISEYSYIYKGKLSNNTPALYFDGVKGTANLSTEILVMNSSTLKNLIYNKDDKASLIDKTVRNYGSWAVDINHDGVYEIPNITPALGYENTEKHLRLNFTNWYNYEEGALRLIKTSYVDYTLGYVFSLPEQWENKVTGVYVSMDNEIFFNEYNKDDPALNQQLVSIKVVKKINYEEKEDDGYQLLRDDGQLMYLFRRYDSSSQLQITTAEIRQAFSLLS